jgi:anaerobic ribonucleoside-triphosphate reductase activating protein
MNYCGITAPDIANGTGCRVVLWISGCNHKCKGCHNPETWDYKYGKVFDEDAKNIIYQWLSKPYIKGLTISGGDPLDRPIDELTEILELCKIVKSRYPDKDIWIYTGYTYEHFFNITGDVDKNNNKFICQEILSYCDTLVDGPYMEDLRDLSIPFRGSKNQRVIDLKLTMHNV